MPIYENYSDDHLADLLNSGDHSAYVEIYNRYKVMLYVFTYRRMGNKEDARDLVQELFLSLWDKHIHLNISNGILPYLYRSAKNRIIDKLDKKKNENRYIENFQHFLDHSYEPADGRVRENQLKELIDFEIKALPPKMRRVFELSRSGELSRKEIATILGLSEETVKSHMHHALSILKNRLGPLYVLVFLLK